MRLPKVGTYANIKVKVLATDAVFSAYAMKTQAKRV